MTLKGKLLILILIGHLQMMAQTKPARIWATATFNKSEVQVGEPLVVTVTVYTSTWFTQPPIFEEIQVKGSLMTRLDQRSNATSVTIANKQYPAIKQRFVIYPNIIGENILPSFKVTTECPPEGGYKGVVRDVFTKKRSFNVLAPPEGVDPKDFFSAYNVTIKDKWNRDLNKVKAGDVLERRITINASGSLAAVIPQIILDSVDFGSVYLKSPILNNRQNKNSFSGTRTEIINYLLEKDGSFRIPEIRLKWYNLKTKTYEETSIASASITIAANPDLEFILTRQKELQSELEATREEEEPPSEPFSFMGLNWWQLALVVIVLVVLTRFIIKLVQSLISKTERRKLQKLNSEAHYFELLKQAIHNKDEKHIVRALYAWYDRYRAENSSAQFAQFIANDNEGQLQDEAQQLEQYYFSENKNNQAPNYDHLLRQIKKLRSKIDPSKSENTIAYNSLNP